VEALAKAAEETAAAGSNGGLGGEVPFSAPPAGDTATGASGSVFSGVQEDEIGAVFDQVLSSGLQKMEERPAINPLVPPPEGESLNLQGDFRNTLVVAPDALKKLAEVAEAHASAEEAKEQAKKNGASGDWFVAVDEQQVGPLALEKVKDMWDRGEIGPDSLCWRAGMADWTPLSDVKELASELAPKPTKPVVAVPATAVVGSVVTVPVESSFNSGGFTHVVRSEMPMAAAAPDAAPAADSGAWKPSAASALASLVSEEMSALAKKPKPRSLLESSGEHATLPAQAAAAKAPGLFDIPSAPVDPGLNGKGMFSEIPAPAGGIAPVPMQMPMAPAPALAQHPNAPYAGPVYGTQVPYPTYATPPPRQGLSTTIKLGIGGAGAFFLILLGLVIYLLVRPAPVVVQPPQAVAQRDDAPVPAPSPGTTEQQPAATVTPPAQPPATASPPVAEPATPPAKPEVKPVETVVAERDSSATRKPRVDRPASAGRDEGETVTPPPKKTETTERRDDFDDLFDDGKKTTETTPDKRRGYIPPAPGGGDVKETLTDQDVMQVVLKNKASLAGCKEGGVSGRLVMQWTVLTSGKTTGVTVVSEEFKGTSVAKCLTGVIRGWTFPKHRTQREPIKFPFTM
jgi:hypothetical protein